MISNSERTAPANLAIAGEMGERIVKMDWSKTRLGPIETWSPSLSTTVSLMLHSSLPMLLWWTDDYISLYNDAYIPVLGAKHPWGLGKPVRECWSEIWHVLKPLIDTPFNGGPATWIDDICLIINRNNFVEETHFTVAYSPAPDPSAPGGIGGVLATVVETTAKVINERTLGTLGRISSCLMGCQSEQEVLIQTAQAIGENKTDFPFAAVYTIDEPGKAANLVATAGIGRNEIAAPEHIDLSQGDARYGYIRDALETREPVLVPGLSEKFPDLPKGSWEEPPHYGIAIPVVRQTHSAPTAVIFAGLNPFRKPDNQYGSFIRLITDQVVQGLANATMIEAERKRSEAIAELDKAKTQFFSNISHEFRTPITLMLGPLEELLNRNAGEWGPETRHPVETAHRNALRLLRLVNTLLDFSRLESGRHEARYVPTDISAYTQSLAGNFRSAIEKAGLRFDVRVDGHLPLVYLDAAMFEKIVFNLLSNAFKFTLEGGISVHVTMTGEAAVLTVADTGVGIPATELPHVFDRFHRVQNTAGRSFEGSGIGLSLTKELIHLHGGTIRTESVMGKGTRFVVEIPFGKSHLPAAQVFESTNGIAGSALREYIEEAASLAGSAQMNGQPQSSGGDHHGRDTILIVDDNADMRQHVQSIVSTHYEVLTAANGHEAMGLIGRHRPALVLSDLMMPVMDGAQLLREMKRDRETAQIPIILITARAGEESRVEGFETGADDYLVKPFSGKELLSRIKAQLRISKLRIHAYNQMKSLFMQAPVAIQILRGPDFTYELVNDYSARLMGRDKNDVMGKPLLEVLPNAQEVGYLDMLRRVYETGEAHTVDEMPYELQVDGRLMTCFVRFVCTALRDEDHHIQGVLVTGEEITAQVTARRKIENDMLERRVFTEQLEKEVAIRTRDLLRANKELESFNYVTSHDLQEPLRKIQMFIDRISNDPESTEIFLGKINESAVRMRQLIDSMLQYSRLTQDPRELTPTDLKVVLADVCRDLELLIEEKKATIRIDALPVLPGNQFQLKQLFTNLLSNSLKFSAGPPVISVQSFLESGDQIPGDPLHGADRIFARISVRDNGIGFDQQYSKKIFELFQRLHTKHQYSGTGIGLSIVKKIVDQHNGFVAAESGDSGGTVFHVWLPVE